VERCGDWIERNVGDRGQVVDEFGSDFVMCVLFLVGVLIPWGGV